MSQLNVAELSKQSERVSAFSIAPITGQNEVHQKMSLNEVRKQFISVFTQTACHLHRWSVFSDFIMLAASEMDIARIKTKENIEQARGICGRYEKTDIENFHQLFLLMIDALEAEFHDFLGSVFMELELGSEKTGQHFTPYHVQSMMTRLRATDIEKTIRHEGFATINEPACGSGGMVIAFAEYLLNAGFNPSAHLFAECTDIDPVVADIAFIQLSLLGIPARVITGNTLTRQFSRVRYTPVYYLNNFEEKLDTQRRIKAIADLIYGNEQAS